MCPLTFKCPGQWTSWLLSISGCVSFTHVKILKMSTCEIYYQFSSYFYALTAVHLAINVCNPVWILKKMQIWLAVWNLLETFIPGIIPALISCFVFICFAEDYLFDISKQHASLPIPVQCMECGVLCSLRIESVLAVG